jgi:hypothetical protein
MRFIRGENAEHGLTVADGEAGRGIYFIPSCHRKMVEHYSKDARRIVEAIPKDGCVIVDLTCAPWSVRLIQYAKESIERTAKHMGNGYVKPRITMKNVQRFGRIVEDFIRRCFGRVDGYLVPHCGPGIPTGRQLVITDENRYWIKERRKTL